MRILIVDDEAGALQALMAVVKAIPGHDVRVAASAQKAHEQAAALGGVDLLITDVVMDPTDGFTLRAEMLGLYPSMQAVFVSGYDLTEYAEQTAGTPVLSKPVDADALRTEIENAAARLAAPPAAAVAAVSPVAEAQSVAVPVVKAPAPQPVAVATPQAPSPVVAQPSAVPRAVPAQPVSVPQPAVRAVPQGMPVAAAAQPTVRAVPQAAPVAAAPAAPVSAAIPAAQPTVRAVPQATPAAVARAVPAPSVPPAQPTVRAVPQAKAAPAAPRAAVASAVVAVSQSGAVVQPQAPVPAAAPGGPPDPLIGVQLGDYRVQQFIGDGKWGRVYLALQLSVNRRVGLKVLNPERAEDEGVRAQFLADARAKAAVQHPFIMSVFEADERNGLAFYTHEFLDGASMAERIARGQRIDEKTALHVLKVAGEGLQYLWSHNLSHSPVDAGSLRLGGDNIARMANIAAADTDPAVTVEQELLTVGTVMQQLTQDQPISGGLRALLARMTGGPNPVTGWPVVLQAVKALEPKVIPVEAAKMKAADAAAMRAVEAARKAKKRALYFSVATLCVLVLILAVVVWRYVLSNARRLDVQVQIPAGTYTVGDAGAKASLGAFEIDRYEVSINEYAKFIAWCEKNPENEHKYDHPRGERKYSHVNDEAKTLILNAAVRGGRVFKQEGNPARGIPSDPGVEIDLNSPMVGVTFWDAYAYARWRGEVLEGGTARDLPTEEEWEAAARGPKGFKYPWGDEVKLKNFNSNQGYKSLAPGGTKTDDGYNYWAPVDAFGNDESDFKVVGMAGNVCEWVYRKEGNKEIPLLKGGSFASEPIPMWGRILKIPVDDAWFVWPAANKPKGNIPPPPGASRYFVDDDVTASFRSLYVGFRTVKRK
jgi:formylglycine-generating enzyme required for sulfatase activity/DNA-binding NarL/FixJ family response regulator